MLVLGLVLLFLVVCFGTVLLVGAPYVPTLRPQVKAALELLDLKPGETLLELGCGDGKVLVAAAKSGLTVVGYELNPLLAFIAWLRTRRYGQNVVVIWGDFWQHPWPEAEGIFTFLLPKYMPKLNKKVAQYSFKPVKLASFAFAIPGKKAVAEQGGVHLYIYK